MNCGVVIAFSSTRLVWSHSAHLRCDVVGDRLAALLLLQLLDLEPHLLGLLRFEAEVDDRDLARAARLRLLLQGLVDHGAVGVGVVDAEDGDGLVVLRQLVDQVAGGAG